MKKIKVLSIFGTRPEAIKMAPIIKELEKCEHINSSVCITAQHRDMLDQVLNIFDIKPDYDLDIMTKNQTLTHITTKALEGLVDTIAKDKPDLILVHGDTTTTFVGALASFYSKVKIGHVEAGLRTNNKYEPFPEELNRRLAGVMADIHFAPTDDSKKNLLKENTPEDSIIVTGNSSIDCVNTTIKGNYKFSLDELNDIDYTNKKVIVVTAHRRENIGKPLENICDAMLDIVNQNKDVHIVYAVHFNPLVREIVNKKLANHSSISLVDPLDILDMHNLIDKSFMVMTDSGGLQEEAPSIKKPVFVLRNVTERPEGVEAGVLKLVGTDKNFIVTSINDILTNKDLYEKMTTAKNPFGDGSASSRIVQFICYYFGIMDKKPKEFK